MAEIYTKADYLTPLQFAKKYNIDPDIVKKAVQKAILRRATITLKRGGISQEIVIGKRGSYHLRPEPAAHEKIKQIINEIQGAQK